jgi:hypothetical protein
VAIIGDAAMPTMAAPRAGRPLYAKVRLASERTLKRHPLDELMTKVVLTFC